MCGEITVNKRKKEKRREKEKRENKTGIAHSVKESCGKNPACNHIHKGDEILCMHRKDSNTVKKATSFCPVAFAFLNLQYFKSFFLQCDWKETSPEKSTDSVVNLK